MRQSNALYSGSPFATLSNPRRQGAAIAAFRHPLWYGERLAGTGAGHRDGRQREGLDLDENLQE